MRRLYFLVISFFLITLLPIPSFSAQADVAKLQGLLESECTNLNKDKLFNRLKSGFPSEIEKGLSPDLLRIIQGVIKRTDFDGISEEKTVEIIGLVFEAFKKGALLQYLDQIFDVAYAKTISVNQLYAAANALREFDDSDVPQDIYEEFVYKGIEDKWDPAAVPVLARGLIYGVDRGLMPQRVALSIMIDLEKGELKRKTPDKLVLDAIKFVRDIEPEKWKPLSEVEKALVKRKEKKMELEGMKKVVETKRLEKETDRKKAEEELKRIREEKGKQKAEQEKRAGEVEARLKAYQNEIIKYQKEQFDLEDALKKQAEEMEREKERKSKERDARRKKDLDSIGQKISEHVKSGNLDIDRLFAAVERYIGIPYRFGGDSESGIDCSAFTRRVYREQDIELPRSSREQAIVGNRVDGNSMEPGDLVFFDTSIVGAISHVGVYLDNNTFAHASKSQGVTKSSIKEKYYSKRFVKANRVFAVQ